MHTKTRTTAWLLVIVLMASGSAFAIRKGGLVGKVIDPDGNPIEGVTVTATSAASMPSTIDTSMSDADVASTTC